MNTYTLTFLDNSYGEEVRRIEIIRAPGFWDAVRAAFNFVLSQGCDVDSIVSLSELEK